MRDPSVQYEYVTMHYARRSRFDSRRAYAHAQYFTRHVESEWTMAQRKLANVLSSLTKASDQKLDLVIAALSGEQAKAEETPSKCIP